MTTDNVTLHLGRCQDELANLPDNSVDAVVTDPPYGLSKEPDITEVLTHWLAGDDAKVNSQPRKGRKHCLANRLGVSRVMDSGGLDVEAGEELVSFRIQTHLSGVPFMGTVPVEFNDKVGFREEEVHAEGSGGPVEDVLVLEGHPAFPQTFHDGQFRLRKREGFSGCVGECSCYREGPPGRFRVVVGISHDTAGQSEGTSDVVATSGAEVCAILALDLGRCTGELLPADGTGEEHPPLLLVSTGSVGASPGAGGLASVAQPDSIGQVDIPADLTGAFDAVGLPSQEATTGDRACADSGLGGVEVPPADFTLLLHSSTRERLLNPTIPIKGFMGKTWDSFVPGPGIWKEVFRVMKPGAHLVAFGGTRTYGLLEIALRLAGFEIRDSLHWHFGSGFPKSLSVGKAIDKAAGAERTVKIGERGLARRLDGAPAGVAIKDDGGLRQDFDKVNTILAPATEAAKKWEGWGTALKPAHEPIILARKPLTNTVAANILEHGTGALNIDGCRVTGSGGSEARPSDEASADRRYTDRGATNFAAAPGPRGGDIRGRWPPNVLLTHNATCKSLGVRRVKSGSGFVADHHGRNKPRGEHGIYHHGEMRGQKPTCYVDEDGKEAVEVWGCTPGCPVQELDGQGSGAARFFPVSAWDPEIDVPFLYQAKPPKAEREAGRPTDHTGGRWNQHPTVKPVALMQWLVRLVTPPAGRVLDPFMGSGTTGMAVARENVDRGGSYRFTGIELEPESFEIAKARIAFAEELPKGEPVRAVPLEAPTEKLDILDLFGA